jgi:hypothetical protein
MKTVALAFLGMILLGCGSAKVEETTILNPTDNPKGVLGEFKANTLAREDSMELKKVPSKVKSFSTPEDIEKAMVFLTADELQGRDTGSEGISNAADYIQKVFEANYVQPYFSTYRDTLTNYDGIAYNLVGYLPGTDPKLKNEFIVLGAHYDHIGVIGNQEGDTIANGANDNASGTTVVLELAKYFGTNKINRRSLIFTLFTAEEKGLLGSKHLANKLKEEGMDLYTMLNFEMVGVPMVNKDHSLYLTGYELSNLAAVSNSYAQKNLVGFLPKAKEFNLFRRSDNAPFHDVFNVPSQTYSSFDFTNFTFYHQVGDEASKMDYGFMASTVNEVIPMLTGIINAPTKEINYK